MLPAEATRLDWVRLDSIDQIKINSFGIDFGNAERWVRKYAGDSHLSLGPVYQSP